MGYFISLTVVLIRNETWLPNIIEIDPPNLSGWIRPWVAGTRGVTSLNGARGKKQIWRPHVRT